MMWRRGGLVATCFGWWLLALIVGAELAMELPPSPTRGARGASSTNSRGKKGFGGRQQLPGLARIAGSIVPVGQVLPPRGHAFEKNAGSNLPGGRPTRSLVEGRRKTADCRVPGLRRDGPGPSAPSRQNANQTTRM